MEGAGGVCWRSHSCVRKARVFLSSSPHASREILRPMTDPDGSCDLSQHLDPASHAPRAAPLLLQPALPLQMNAGPEFMRAALQSGELLVATAHP